MKLIDAITTARPIIGDAREPYRYKDERLLGYGNDAIQLIALAQPDLFRAIGDVGCSPGLAIQTFPLTESNGVVDVLYVKGGNVVTRTDRFTMNRFTPNWMTAEPGPCKHWMPIEGDRNRFMIYPPAPEGQVLVCTYNAVPPTYGMHDEVEISNSYAPVIANYIVAMAEFANEPSVLTARAMQFIQLFTAALGQAGNPNYMERVKERMNAGV